MRKPIRWANRIRTASWSRTSSRASTWAADDAAEYGHVFERHERTRRPLGGRAFILMLEKTMGRMLQLQKPGRKPKKRRDKGK